MKKLYIVSVMQPNNLWCRNHTLLMARALCESYDITILSNQDFPLTDSETDFFPSGRAPILANIFYYFQYNHNDDDFILYQLANNDHFSWIAECFIRHPGAVLMHDISLFWLLCQTTGLKEKFIEEEIGICNAIMLKNSLDWDRPVLSSTGVHAAYYNRAILQYAAGIVTHSPYQADAFRRKFPDIPVHSVPLVPNFLHQLTPLTERTDLADHRRHHGIPERAITFGVMGFQAFHKRLPELLEGFCKLEPTADVSILLIGKWDETVRKQCAKSLAELQQRGWVVLVDRYVPEAELETFIAISDILVNFRYPTAGESSGIACQALSVGVPLLVNKIGSFVDLPDSSVIRVPFATDGSESDAVADILRDIINNPILLREKQEAARANVAYYRMPRYSADYCRIIAEQMEGYEARRAQKQRRLAIRRENDAWYPTRRPGGGDVAVMLASDGTGISLRNPLLGDREIFSIIIKAMESSSEDDPALPSLVRGVSEPFDPLQPGLDLSGYSSLCLATLPDWDRTALDTFLESVFTLPVGARLLVPAAFLDILAIGQGFEQSGLGASVNDYMKTLLIEVKYATEVALYRYGLHILEDMHILDKRYVVLRYGSTVHSYR